MSLIKTENLVQQHDGQEILRGISLSVAEGETLAIIGPTGAGKTTLLRLLGLLDVPTSGEIYFDGTAVPRSGKLRLELRRKMAFVLQKPMLFSMNVYDNIAAGLRWRGIGSSAARQRVEAALETVGLSAYQHRNAKKLSGGEVQRVAIARSLVLEPDLLLLDEPTANLDPTATLKIENTLLAAINRYHTTIVMATHDFAQGQRLSSRIGVLIDGEIHQAGDPRQVFNSPRSSEVASFVGVENIIRGVVVAQENKLATIEAKGNLIAAVSDLPVGREVGACIRPEEIIISLVKSSSSARNSFIGEIKHMVAMGSLTRIEVDCGFPLVALITTRSAEELGLQHGKKVNATFKATGVHVIEG